MVSFREACINFKDLCKKKNEDRLWVDEIAAMQAMVQPELAFMGTSGIILAGEENDPSKGVKQNGSTDVSMSDSVASHGSSDANAGAFRILSGCLLLFNFCRRFSGLRCMK